MSKKKLIFDIVFIVIASGILIALLKSELGEKYIAFLLIPILIAYYCGQFVERNTRK